MTWPQPALFFAPCIQKLVNGLDNCSLNLDDVLENEAIVFDI